MTLRSFWQIIGLSFYSKDLYLSIAYRWKAWGLKFLLMFSLLTASITSIILYIIISTFNLDERRGIFDDFPPLKIENGQALVDTEVNLPLTIKYPDSMIDVVVIDLDSVDAKKYAGKNIILFGKDKIVFSETDDFSISYRDLLKGSDITILNGDNIIALLKSGQAKLLGVILFLGVPVGALLYFIATIFKSFLYAGIASILAKISKYDLNFKQLTRLAVVVNAPAFLLQALLLLMSLWFGSIAQVIAENIYLFYFTYAFIVCGRSAAAK